MNFLNLITQFTPGACFLGFLFFSVLAWHIVLTTTPEDAEDAEGHRERVFKVSEITFWTEISIGFIVAAIAIGSWLTGLL